MQYLLKFQSEKHHKNIHSSNFKYLITFYLIDILMYGSIVSPSIDDPVVVECLEGDIGR